MMPWLEQNKRKKNRKVKLFDYKMILLPGKCVLRVMAAVCKLIKFDQCLVIINRQWTWEDCIGHCASL